MDKLFGYIQNGQPVKTQKILFGTILFSILVGVLFYGLSYYILHTPENLELIKSIPTIELKDGVITAPTDTVWEKDIENGAHLKLNTKIDTTDSLEDNTILLTKTRLYLKFKGTTQSEELPKITQTINKDFFEKRLIQTSGMITVLIFVSLLIGGCATYVLSLLISHLFHREWDKEMIKKTSLIGWISIVILNTILLISGFGFSIITGIILATFISLFSLIQVNRPA